MIICFANFMQTLSQSLAVTAFLGCSSEEFSCDRYRVFFCKAVMPARDGLVVYRGIETSTQSSSMSGTPVVEAEIERRKFGKSLATIRGGSPVRRGQRLRAG